MSESVFDRVNDFGSVKIIARQPQRHPVVEFRRGEEAGDD